MDEEEGAVNGFVGLGGPAVIGVDSSVGTDASRPGLGRDGAGSDNDGGAAVGADVNAGAGVDAGAGMTNSAGSGLGSAGVVGASGAVGAASATGGDGDGDGVGEDVGAGVAGDLKCFSTPRRSPFVRRKKAGPVVSTGQPRILGLQRLLTRRVLQALVKPKSADDGFHSSDTLDAMLREVVMYVHGVSDPTAKDMLRNVYRPAVPSASGRAKTASSARKAKEPAPVALRLWLSKTRNNIHCSLKKVIQRTWAEGACFDGRSMPAAAEFLGGHCFLESVAGRRGTVLATLATILYCGGNLEECTFPGGENGTAVVKVDLTALAFVLSKIRLSLEQVCVKDLLPVGNKKPSASGLHGGVVKMGRVVWTKELKYLHAHVDSNTDGWGALISTNKGDKCRANITDDPGAPSASIDLKIDVEKRRESVDVVTPAEVAQLKQLVRDWVAERKDGVAVIDNDDDANPPAGRGADGGGGDGGGDAGGGGAGVGVGDGGAGNRGGGAGGENLGGDGGGGGEGGAGTSGGAHPGTSVRGDRGGGDDAPSGTDAAIDYLFGVARTRHPLSPTTSEKRPVMLRKLRPKWSCSRVDSDAESTGRSSENNSDLDFIVSDGSPESLQSSVCVSCLLACSLHFCFVSLVLWCSMLCLLC
eukprot:TRINITY_DN1010_c0_g1_i4.p1 TRINITY_DN1010_c0_g1~~TRINITY_DN1010_c0_g1_i4.p1  ORF type:complete len:643 (+),score=94.84 TRINITY_DN1010_c0_g1_i4:2155-4083(+)